MKREEISFSKALWMPLVVGMHQYSGLELYTGIYVQVCEEFYWQLVIKVSRQNVWMPVFVGLHH